MVKKREAFRPFAPSVLEDRADEFFELPATQRRLPFMLVVVNVRVDKRALLGAVTHVNGTARIQTVSRRANERFWRLIDAFDRLTGVPMLLNTSFNNNVEPIVDSIADGLVCYLTTALDYLVVGNFLVTRKDTGEAAYETMRVSLPPTAALRDRPHRAAENRDMTVHEIAFAQDRGRVLHVSDLADAVLRRGGTGRVLGDVSDALGLSAAERASVITELVALWSQRAIRLEP
jgi:carbamoyltransferase